VPNTEHLHGDGPTAPDNRTMAQAINDAIQATSQLRLSPREAEAAVVAVYEWLLSRGIDIMEFRG
jgi:hypothetical protein